MSIAATRRGLAKLAASKILSYLGILVATLAAICLANRDDNELTRLLPEPWGARACALLIIGGAVTAGTGQGIFSRRSGMKDAGLTPREPASRDTETGAGDV